MIRYREVCPGIWVRGSFGLTLLCHALAAAPSGEQEIDSGAFFSTASLTYRQSRESCS
jgi:hypothetical protein